MRLCTLIGAAVVLGVCAPSASSHAMPTSAVTLAVDAHAVRGELRLPLDRLAVALERPLTAAEAGGAMRASLARYTAARIRAVGDDGRAWGVSVTGLHVERGSPTDDLLETVTLTPPDGRVTDFDLHYGVILDQLVTHQAIVTLRTPGAASRTLGTFDWTRKSVHVDAGGASWLQGFTPAVHLGIEHIGQGADHLLFLLMLLLPAPLIARAGRWRRSDDGPRSVRRVLHVVTAFAVGHSTTLALAALGVVHVPSRVIESLIAVSILVSAIHALRPLTPRGEPLIAAGFGLVHGVAFASLLGGVGLDGEALVWSLLGFNLGIELTQLLVVALMMPSLYLLSRSPLYEAVRIAIACFGLVLSGSWLLERSTVIGNDPLAAVSDALIQHPFVVVAAFALLAAATASIPSTPFKTGAISE